MVDNSKFPSQAQIQIALAEQRAKMAAKANGKPRKNGAVRTLAIQVSPETFQNFESVAEARGFDKLDLIREFVLIQIAEFATKK